ncbi:MAG TPA: zf-HC2 domain-containing protein [Longimicrobiales bacterium]|nr:zf-HC2 domain-containing protein [Longimicrobiales bacterium]
MSRYHSEWTDRFSDYLAEELDEAGQADVEAHLAECGACRDVLAELRAVVARARQLGDVEPPRDLWSGIASAIDGPVRTWPRPEHRHGDRSVIELPSARAAGAPLAARGAPGGMGLGRAGLAAAAAGLVALSVGTTWWIAEARMGAAGAPETADTVTGEAVLAAAAGAPSADLASELATLEDVLEAARGTLDPNTVLVLERNLGVIEQAIADSREALALDPGNAFLSEHLERMYRRKLVYLQDAVRVAQWSG